VPTRTLNILVLILVAVCGAPDMAAAQTRAVASNGQPSRIGKPTVPKDTRGRTILANADRHQGLKILVSTEDKWLWLVSGRDTLLSAQVAIGMRSGFTFEGRRFYFETPRSERRVLAKEENPRWNVPEWHYMRRALDNEFDLVRLAKETKHLLDDGSFILTIGNNVGRLNEFGNFWAFPPGMEIMFDGKVFMPPVGTEQRRVPDALGPYKLDTGDGYLLHGTNIFNEESIGQAVSHGCVRLTNEELATLYRLTPVGTPVFIF
jgi:hypothetical protein